jgi:hypothetical protein
LLELPVVQRGLVLLAILVASAPARANPRRAIERIDAWILGRAAGAVERKDPLPGKPYLRRVTHASKDELLHIDPMGSRKTLRGPNERGVYLTARHLGLPLRVAPPMVPRRTTTREGMVTPWLRGVRKIAGTNADPALYQEVMAAAPRPERFDWESLHAVVILDYITDQDDRGTENIHFREVRGKLTAVSLDNELTFGAHVNHHPVARSVYAELVRRSSAVEARRLSPRLLRGLRGIDVEAWKADLGRAGLSPYAIEQAARRLAQVQKDGLAAIWPEARAWH